MSTRKPTVFVGSSREDLPVLEAVERLLAPVAKVIPWTNEDEFREVGDLFLDSLVEASGKFDFAILIFGRGDVVHSRGKKQAAPRDNVVFELGLFISKLGRQRTFVIAPSIWRTGLRILSDIEGLKIEQYHAESRKKDYDVTLKPICRRIAKKMREPRGRQDLHRPRGVTDVRRPLEDLIERARARRRPAVIRNIALDMESTWPLVHEMIRTPSSEVKEITWRSLMIDSQSKVIRKYASDTVSLSTARDVEKKIVSFFGQNGAELALRKIRFECRAYADLPTMHGFLFNDETLFFSVCGVENGKLAGSANPYIRFDRPGARRDDESPAHFIRAFEEWFEESWRHARKVWPR